MNVGLPGTGIGGLFYLATALLMPVWELLRAMNGRSSAARWRDVAEQTSLALAILVALWTAAWVVGWLFPTLAPGMRAAATTVTHRLGVTPTKLTAITLGMLLMTVEGLYLMLSVVRLQRK